VDNPQRMHVDRTSVTDLLFTRGNTRPLVYLEDAILVARHKPLPAVRGTTILADSTLTGGDPLDGEVNWREEIIAQRTDLHGTAWLFDGRKLHCFCRRHWMVIDPRTLETETFATDFEAMGIAKLSSIPFYNPFFSAHYGILVPTEVVREQQTHLELFQIRIPPVPAEDAQGSAEAGRRSRLGRFLSENRRTVSQMRVAERQIDEILASQNVPNGLGVPALLDGHDGRP
jgi:hypothetical protein